MNSISFEKWYRRKLDSQIFTGEIKSHYVPHSYGLVPYLSKKLSKLLQIIKS